MGRAYEEIYSGRMQDAKRTATRVSSRRLEKEAQRNVEAMWLTGRLTPDFKTIADFRKDNGKAIRSVCRQFVVLCQQLGFFFVAAPKMPSFINTSAGHAR